MIPEPSANSMMHGSYRPWQLAVAVMSLFVLSPFRCCLADEQDAASANSTGKRPNIIVMMTDDMGWSDLACYGGEIETPHLDSLAQGGLRFTQFYNTGRCCPTRAALLTGLYSHQAGIGWMNDDWGEKYPGYRGFLNRDCVTIGEALQTAGYFTITTGKWHVGAKNKSMWPVNRGFDRSFSVPAGGGFYYRPSKAVVENDQLVHPGDNTPFPKDPDWYSTDAWVDKGLGFIKDKDADQPFFWYLAFNAPHWPLQADEPEIAKYRERYKHGWDVIRSNRHQRQFKAGLIAKGSAITPRDPKVPAWESLSKEQQQTLTEYMACYAATLDRVDQAIGRLIKTLKENGEYENTLILFLADNGGCAEGGVLGGNATKTKEARLGSADSFIRYGMAWANASNTPFRRYKHHVHEGGISSPLIAHWPGKIKTPGSLTHAQGHVIDLMATCLDVARAKYPGKITPLEGKSLAPIIRGEANKSAHEYIFWEHEGNKAVRHGEMKLVKKSLAPNWELYNMTNDRVELNDLAEKQPELVAEMRRSYIQWSKRANVVGWATRPKKKKKKK